MAPSARHKNNPAHIWRCSSADRAIGSYPIGRWFKSTRRHFLPLLIICACYVPVAQAESPESLIRNLNNNTNYKSISVDKVLSADTIVLADGKKVRLIGVRAPEPPSRPKLEYDKNGLPMEAPVLPENTFEEKAYAFASRLLLGKTVRLEFDESRNDDDFTTLAYIFLVADGTFVNAEIIRQGYADLQLKPPNLKHEDVLREAYREARREKRGMQSD